jgi:hypothetical protein
VNDKQRVARLDKALAALKKTTRGYTPEGVHWRTALEHLRALRADLQSVSRVPALGPVVRGGKTILAHDLTHATSGVPGFPAFDDGFGAAGLAVLAPEPLVVYRQSGAQGGDAFYARGDSRIEYWFGHVDQAPATGARFRKGQTMARIARIGQDDGGPHVHVGINARPLIGRDLRHRTNYSHGAPTVGAQLAEALDA